MDAEYTAQTPMTLRNKVLVVTGATGAIGRAIALCAAEAGAIVGVHGRQADRVEAIVQTIQEQNGSAVPLIADLSRAEEIASLVEEAFARLGRMDVWVNNAGVDILTPPYRERSFDERLHALLDVDVRATIALSRSVGARMREQPAGGLILNIGWDGVDYPMPGDSAQLFATAKGAVTAFTKSLAASLAPSVRALVLAPGWIRTEWGEHAAETWTERARRESLSGRWGAPEDIGRLVRLLASEEAGFLSGQVIEANGGFRHRSTE